MSGQHAKPKGAALTVADCIRLAAEPSACWPTIDRDLPPSSAAPAAPGRLDNTPPGQRSRTSAGPQTRPSNGGPAGPSRFVA